MVQAEAPDLINPLSVNMPLTNIAIDTQRLLAFGSPGFVSAWVLATCHQQLTRNAASDRCQPANRRQCCDCTGAETHLNGQSSVVQAETKKPSDDVIAGMPLLAQCLQAEAYAGIDLRASCAASKPCTSWVSCVSFWLQELVYIQPILKSTPLFSVRVSDARRSALGKHHSGEGCPTTLSYHFSEVAASLLYRHAVASKHSSRFFIMRRFWI